MHLQTGKGENVDAITPGMISVTDNPNPVTGGSLTYRSAAQFNNSWNWNIHYRAAAVVHHRLAQLQGRLQQRLPPPREHELHRPERRRTATTLPTGSRTQITYRDHAAHHRGQRGLRLRHVRAGPLDDRPVDAAGRDPLSTRSEQLSRHRRSRRRSSRRTLNVQFDRIENLKLEGHHAEDGRDLRPVRQRQDGAEGHAEQVPRRHGDDRRRRRPNVSDSPNPINRLIRSRRLAPGPTTAANRRRSRDDFTPAVRPAELQRQRRVRRPARTPPPSARSFRGTTYDPGPDAAVGASASTTGSSRERAARADAARVAQRPVRAPLVRELPRHRRPRRHRGGLRPLHVRRAERQPAAERRRHAHGIRSEADRAGDAAATTSRSPTTTAT